MRTTIRLDEALARRTKAAASERGVSFTQAIAEALSQWLRKPKPPSKDRVPFDPPLSNAASAPMSFEEFKRMTDDADAHDEMRKLPSDGPKED